MFNFLKHITTNGKIFTLDVHIVKYVCPHPRNNLANYGYRDKRAPCTFITEWPKNVLSLTISYVRC